MNTFNRINIYMRLITSVLMVALQHATKILRVIREDSVPRAAKI